MRAVRGKRVSALACLLFALFLRSGWAQNTADSLSLYQSALAEANASKRTALLEEVVDRFPAYIEARYALGAEYFKQRNYEKCIPHFEYIVSHDSDFALRVNLTRYLSVAYNAAATYRIALGQPEAAIEFLKKVLSFKPDNALAYYNLGNAYYQLNRFEEAITSYQKAIQIGSQDPIKQATYWYNLGAVYFATGDLDKAIEAYTQALRHHPGLNKAREFLQKARARKRLNQKVALADSALAANHPEESVRLLRQVLAADSTHEEAKRLMERASLALTYSKALQAIEQNKLSQALEWLGQLPQSYRDVRTLHHQVRQALKRAGRQKQYASQWQQALRYVAQNQPDSARALLLQMAEANVMRRQVDSLLAVLTPAAESALEPPLESRAPLAAHSAETDSIPENVSEAVHPETPAEEEQQLASKEPVVAAAEKSLPAGRPLPVPRPLWLLIGTALTALAGYYVYYLRRRDRNGSTEAQDMAWEEGNEALPVSHVDEAEAPASPDGEHPNEKSAEFDEAEIAELMANSDEISALHQEKEDTEQTGRTQDEEDFMALVQEEGVSVSTFEEEDSSMAIVGGDTTRTVDMSQFKLKKIGRFILEKEIGRGAAGRVYKAWDPKLDRTVVIKTVSYSLTASEDEITRLKARVYREAKTAAKLNHPNIVVVYDVEDESTFSYIVMEYVEGPDLRQLLSHERRLDPHQAVKYVKQVCMALDFAHTEGIIHRDIKPSNILIVGKEKVKVTDFGIAKVVNHLTLTQTGRVVGTPSYMAPEQIEGEDVDARADIFSLGVVFYELLTGKRPFSGDSLASLAYKIVHVDPVPPSLINLELSETYDEVINKAIAKDPNQRYQSAAEFLEELQKIQAHIESKP